MKRILTLDLVPFIPTGIHRVQIFEEVSLELVLVAQLFILQRLSSFLRHNPHSTFV